MDGFSPLRNVIPVQALTVLAKLLPPECFMRKLAIAFQALLLFAVSIFGVVPRHALAQSKPAGAANSPLCTRENALEMIRQQIDVSRTLNNTQRRISLLIRTADLLWPYQQDRARAVFSEAFELASEGEKETREQGKESII